MKIPSPLYRITWLFLLSLTIAGCSNDSDDPIEEIETEWTRVQETPVLRDLISEENYEVASDPHVFLDEDGQLKMVYTGDKGGVASIKLASGTSIKNWQIEKSLLFEPGPLGRDINKETPFYRQTADGTHQIYYIGYEDGETYRSEIYLAEADRLEGPYVQRAEPVVPRGQLAGENVYLITSPSIVEHDGVLHIAFIGWNAAPDAVSEIWIIGATSSDEGRTWDHYEKVEVPIGAEGQVTKITEDRYVSVATRAFGQEEAIYYFTAEHPFGPWTEESQPILTQDGPFEKDEIIAPQIYFDGDREYLFYTGADHSKGWWVMVAERME